MNRNWYICLQSKGDKDDFESDFTDDDGGAQGDYQS